MSSERYATTRVPYARAIGAPSVVSGHYDGAELKTRSARAGAYDALTFPSRIGTRQVLPLTHPDRPADVPKE